MSITQQPALTDWPDGVIARYVTVGGATVNVWDATQQSPQTAICSGCGASSRDGSRIVNSSNPPRWGQEHAEVCRAMPKPEAGNQ